MMMGMDNHSTLPLDAVLKSLAETRGRLEAIEASWKINRAESRRLTVALITEYGYSVNKAAVISSHQRSTIMTWLAADGIETRK